MDYSQFLIMPQEIGLLVRLLVSVHLRHFYARNACSKHLPMFTTICLPLYTVFSFLPGQMGDGLRRDV